MKIIFLTLLLLLFSLPTFAQYKPIPKDLNQQYKQKESRADFSQPKYNSRQKSTLHAILVNKKYNKIIKEQQLIYKLYYRFGGKLQQQYEKGKSLKYKDFEKYTALYIVQQDLKNYRCCHKSIYGEVIYLINNADETNHRFLLQIKKNFDNCSKNLKCWQPIEIDDYNYAWLDNATKFVIWFNNMVYLTK